MKKVIIGIHGLGNKPSKDLLQDWWVKSMHEGLNRIGSNERLPEFELVYWADITNEKHLSTDYKDPEHPLHLKEYYTPLNKNYIKTDDSTRRKISDFVINQLNKILLNPDYSLNYSYITDAIIKNYFKELSVYYSKSCTIENKEDCKASELIKDRFISVLQKYQGYEIFLVSHSMGTVIAYDALTYSLKDLPVTNFITMGSPLGLPVVISKIAFESKETNNGKVKIQTPSNVAEWNNFSDLEDKIAINYKLIEEFSKNKKGVKPIDHIVNNDYEVNENQNPHKSFGYLRSKEFSILLDKFLTNVVKEEEVGFFQKLKNIFTTNNS